MWYCGKAADKAMVVLRMIKRVFKKVDVEAFRILIKRIVKPHLEYCVQALAPYLRKDIDSLEKVLRSEGGTKTSGLLRSKCYKDMLRILGITLDIGSS